MLTRSLRYLKRKLWDAETNKKEDMTESAPITQAANEISTREILKRYAAVILANENRSRLFAASLLTFLGTALNFIAPALLGKVIYALEQEENILLAGIEMSDTSLMVCLVAAYSFAQLVPNIRDQVLVPVSAYSTKILLTNIVENQLQNKSLHYHNHTTESDKVYILQKAFMVSSVSPPLLTKITPALLEIGIAISLLTYQYGAPLSLSVSTMIAISVTYSAATTSKIIAANENMLHRGREAWEAISGSIGRYKTIHDYNKFETTMQKLETTLQMSMAAEIDSNNIPSKIALGNIAIPRLSMAAAAFYLGNRFQSGQMTVPEFVTLFGYLNQLSSMLPMVGEALSKVVSSYPDLNFIFSELAEPANIIDRHPHRFLQVNGSSRITFDNVSFTYPPNKSSHVNNPIFDNLSFTIEAGQTIALVSASGAGKSTIFNLLYRYYPTANGNIFIDGQNIAEISIASLRKAIGIVGQSPNLFNGTVRENIVFGAENESVITDDDIMALAQSLNLSEFIQSLAKQLDTQVGEGGRALSGGQQQKIAILRGFIKSCSIRLLDEITASLDAESAKSILNGIHTKRADETTIIITHKLAEVIDADNIIVLQEGKVGAQGTHQQLLASCPFYLQLWRNQNAEESSISRLNK